MQTSPEPRPPHRLPNSAAVQHLRIQGPAALVAAVPFLLPRPPEATAVLAVVGGEHRLTLTAQRPLPAFPSGASREVTEQWVDEVALILADGLRALDPRDDERVAVVLYVAAPLGQFAQWFAHHLLQTIPMRGIIDVLGVRDGRWRSLVCDTPTCCPPGGRVILEDSEALRVAAELVGAGLSAGPAGTTDDRGETDDRSRDDRSMQTEPPADVPVAGPAPTVPAEPTVPGTDVVAEILGELPYPANATQRRALLERVWPTLARPRPSFVGREAALLIVAADRPGVRDALLTRMVGAAADDRAFWADQRAVWSALVAAAPPSWRPGPLCLLAVACWALGDRAAADQATEQALQEERGHRMATLLGRLVRTGTPAGRWFVGMSRIDEDECLRFDRQPPIRSDTDPSTYRQAG